MAIMKSSPGELAIHGGGPPAFGQNLPAFSANVGDGARFAALAERMFMDSEPTGCLVEQFESSLAEWLGVRSVIGFSSLTAAARCLRKAANRNGSIFLPAFGEEPFLFLDHISLVDCETATLGLSPTQLANHLNDQAASVLATHALGRPCMVEELEDICDEWGVPLFLYGHQSLGSGYHGERLGRFGEAEIIEFGRDQLVHAMGSAAIATGDDLLAFRLRAARAEHFDTVDQSMGDAAAAMGIANLEACEGFMAANRKRYDHYRQHLDGVPGVHLVRHDFESTFQTVTVEIDPGEAGLSRNALHNVLAAENVGTSKPFEGSARTSAPVASRAASSLLQLPSGPAATDEVIESVCKLVELAIVRSLESPDPIQLAA